MAMAERTDSVPFLTQITCPTQIIVGELDQGTPVSDAKLMAEHIPGSRLAIIPNAAHLANLEQPMRLIRLSAPSPRTSGSNHIWDETEETAQDVQKGHPARPQRVKV